MGLYLKQYMGYDAATASQLVSLFLALVGTLKNNAHAPADLAATHTHTLNTHPLPLSYSHQQHNKQNTN